MKRANAQNWRVKFQRQVTGLRRQYTTRQKQQNETETNAALYKTNHKKKAIATGRTHARVLFISQHASQSGPRCVYTLAGAAAGNDKETNKQANRGTAEIDVRLVPEGVNRSRSGPIEPDEYWVTGATACARTSRRTFLRPMPIRNETKESEAAVTDRVSPENRDDPSAAHATIACAREPTRFGLHRHSIRTVRRTDERRKQLWKTRRQEDV